MNIPLFIGSFDQSIFYIFTGLFALGAAGFALCVSGVVLLLGKTEEKKRIAKWQFGIGGSCLIVAVAAFVLA